MRNALIGSFLGFLMACGVLAACGGGGGGGYTPLTVDELALRVAELESKLQALNGDGSGNLLLLDANLTVRGGNLIVQNGLDSTPTMNGAGNVIIGYNEFRVAGNDRSGSHMLVVGSGLNFSSYGGIVAGHVNGTEAPYASVTGGYRNRATGEYASVNGGDQNHASGERASITGGSENVADGEAAVVSGGRDNFATGPHAAIAGGAANVASGGATTILGGFENEAWADGPYSCVSGGYANYAQGWCSSITGGSDNVITGRCGSITGGRSNLIQTDPVMGSEGCATVSGGYDRWARDEYMWAASTLLYDD